MEGVGAGSLGSGKALYGQDEAAFISCTHAPARGSHGGNSVLWVIAVMTTVVPPF